MPASASDDSSDSDEADFGTHISDDESSSKRTRRDKLLRAADPEKQAKFKHGHQTEVVDAQGRVRFHGAFTGGFSAGFFNTVGSEEGWAPSEWRSTRDSRGGVSAAMRPEDFMDDEDLAGRHGEGKLVARAGFTKPTRAPALPSAEPSQPRALPRGGGAAAQLKDLLHVRPLPHPERRPCLAAQSPVTQRGPAMAVQAHAARQWALSARWARIRPPLLPYPGTLLAASALARSLPAGAHRPYPPLRVPLECPVGAGSDGREQHRLPHAAPAGLEGGLWGRRPPQASQREGRRRQRQSKQ